MAATAVVRMTVECEGLGPGVVSFPNKFTDTNTPDDYRRFDTIISTTANLLSAVFDIPCSELKGMLIEARGGGVYLNTISTTISTAGQFIPAGQSIFMSFAAANSCKVAWKGDAAASAVSGLFYSQIT